MANRPGSPPAAGAPARQQRVASGLFLVPDLPAAIGPTLQVVIRNFADTAAEVPFAVNRIGDKGEKIRLRAGRLAVSGNENGVQQVILTVPELAPARWIEVNFRLPSSEFLPSAALILSALADGTTTVEQWIGPADFAVI